MNNFEPIEEMARPVNPMPNENMSVALTTIADEILSGAYQTAAIIDELSVILFGENVTEESKTSEIKSTYDALYKTHFLTVRNNRELIELLKRVRG